MDSVIYGIRPLRPRRHCAGGAAHQAQGSPRTVEGPSIGRSKGTRACRAGLARLLPFYEYDESRFFRADDAPAEIESSAPPGVRPAHGALPDTICQDRPADGRSCRGYFGYAVHGALSGAVSIQPQGAREPQGWFAADIVQRRDGDRSRRQHASTISPDRMASIVFGYDFYKDCIAQGEERVKALGPVLGAFHPVIIDNVQQAEAISGLDEISFHMSGTEAVMQAVRLARYHTRRSHLVRLCGAYHGWWGDVQPGIGNPIPAHETYTLSDMSEKTLHVLRTRKNIACVLVESAAIAASQRERAERHVADRQFRRAHFDRIAYTDWLKQLRQVCTERGIVLIFDEVFLGFRIARGGARNISA